MNKVFDEKDFLNDMGPNFTNFYEKILSNKYNDDNFTLVTSNIDEYFNKTLPPNQDYNTKIVNAMGDVARTFDFNLNGKEINLGEEDVDYSLKLDGFEEAKQIINDLLVRLKIGKTPPNYDSHVSTFLAILFLNNKNINIDNYTNETNIAIISNYFCSFYQSTLAENQSLLGYPIGILMVIEDPRQIKREFGVSTFQLPECRFDNVYFPRDNTPYDNFFDDVFEPSETQTQNLKKKYFITSNPEKLLVVCVLQYIICLNNNFKIVAVLKTMIFDFTKNQIIEIYKYKWNPNPRYKTSSKELFFPKFFKIMKNGFDHSSSKEKKLKILKFYFNVLGKLDKHEFNVTKELDQSIDLAQSLVSENTDQSLVSENTDQSLVSENTDQSLVSKNTDQSLISKNTDQSFVSTHKKALGGIGALVVGGIVSAAIILSGGKTKKIRRHSNKRKKKKKSINRGKKTHKRKRNQKSLSGLLIRHKK